MATRKESKRYNICFVILFCLVLLFILGCGTSFDDASQYTEEYWTDHPVVRKSIWASLGIQDKEEHFDETMAQLPRIIIDSPPKIGLDYRPVFPSNVPFNPDEWQTNTSSPSIADPRAKRGGTVKYAIMSFPPTIRTEGPNSSLSTLSTIHGLIYERLLGYDAAKGDYTPGLATHWQISEDKRTYRYHINPKARWSNGQPVTADDVIATIEHLQNPDRKAPSTSQYWDEMIEEARMIDRLTIEIKTRKARWRNMLSISTGLPVYPAAYIRMDGETYIKEWNWKLPPGSGPYILLSEDIKQGRSITLRRRNDYWDEDNPNMRGVYNFDKIRLEVVRDSELMYQKLLAGELDMYIITTAQRWINEVDEQEVVRKGWVQKRRIWNRNPTGYGGYCFNMRTPPFNRRKIRLAFAYLFNREKLFSKYFYYQYEYMDSYYPGQEWAHHNADLVRYDPGKARRLLEEEGWIRDTKGRLVNSEDGTEFPKLTLELSNTNASSMRIHNLVKNDLWREAGIEMELKQIDDASLLKKVWDHKFRVVYWFWSASRFPNPEFGFHSRFADQKQSSNLAGIVLPEVDQLIERYKYEFDPAERKTILQRIDELVFNEHPYALAWTSPSFRIIYWDKFNHPPEYASKFGDDINMIFEYWWYDSQKDQRTRKNMSKGISNYPDRLLSQYDDVEQDYWMNHDNPISDTQNGNYP